MSIEDHFDPSLKENDSWLLEQCFRKRLFGMSVEKLPSKQLYFNGNIRQKLDYMECNYLYATNPKNLFDTIVLQPQRSRHYYVPLDQHSSPQILLHGNGGPPLLITTLKNIYLPKKDLPIWSNGSLMKHSRELLLPLIQKTQEIFRGN